MASSTHTQGYQAIGSFHSENVDDLMSQSDDVYIPPVLPFDSLRTIADAYDASHPADSSDFLLDRSTWTFLNHGAFGAGLKVGFQRSQQWRYYLEQQPLRYFDRDLLPHLVYSARRMAEFVAAPREAVTLIPNVTNGLNTVLRGYANTYPEESHVVLWDTSYGSLKKIARRYCKKVTEIPVSHYFDQAWNHENPSEIEISA